MSEQGTDNVAGKKGIDDFLKPMHLLSDETIMFMKTIRQFVDQEILPHEHEVDDYWDWPERKERTFVHDIWKKMFIDLGVQKSFVPPELGGSGGGSTVELFTLVEELSRGDYGAATTVYITPWSIAALALPKPNEFLLKKFAPLLCGDEEYVICSAITEPHAGGSVEDVRLRDPRLEPGPGWRGTNG